MIRATQSPVAVAAFNFRSGLLSDCRILFSLELIFDPRWQIGKSTTEIKHK